MAHTKSSGSAKNVRDSQPKYLGVKKHDGERVKPGDIVIRQRGNTFLAGNGIKQGKDYTLFSVIHGAVKFTSARKIRFDGSRRYAKKVNVIPFETNT
ncbi:MAG: 50S ribosomal protein L27 [Candidatus Colwellbacteria bacterium]|nr:50S ribosomal protein L27 [Candidatus Colwellbacteria bacterium]